MLAWDPEQTGVVRVAAVPLRGWCSVAHAAEIDGEDGEALAREVGRPATGHRRLLPATVHKHQAGVGALALRVEQKPRYLDVRFAPVDHAFRPEVMGVHLPPLLPTGRFRRFLEPSDPADLGPDILLILLCGVLILNLRTNEYNGLGHSSVECEHRLPAEGGADLAGLHAAQDLLRKDLRGFFYLRGLGQPPPPSEPLARAVPHSLDLCMGHAVRGPAELVGPAYVGQGLPGPNVGPILTGCDHQQRAWSSGVV